MSTRSRIGYVREDGKLESIYCHYDGYIEGVGHDLIKGYKTIEDVKKLIGLRSLISLQPTFEETMNDNDNKDARVNHINDYDEMFNVDNTLKDLKKRFYESWCEYLYVFDDNKWWCYAKYQNFCSSLFAWCVEKNILPTYEMSNIPTEYQAEFKLKFWDDVEEYNEDYD